MKALPQGMNSIQTKITDCHSHGFSIQRIVHYGSFSISLEYIVLLILVVVLLFVSGCLRKGGQGQFSGENLLAVGNMERWPQETIGPPRGWVGSGITALRSTDAFEGYYSVRLEAGEGKETHDLGLGDNIPGWRSLIDRRARIRVSLWYKGSESNYGKEGSIVLYLVDGVTNPYVANRLLFSESPQWERLSLTAIVNEKATQLGVLIRLYGAGMMVYVDDVRVEILAGKKGKELVGENLLVSGGMEKWPEGPSEPPWGWTAAGVMVSRSTDAFEGDYSVQVKAWETSGNHDLRLRKSIEGWQVLAQSEATITVSAWHKGVGPYRWGTVVSLYLVDGVTNPYVVSRPSFWEWPKWTGLKLTKTLRKNTRQLRVVIRIHPPGIAVNVDAVKIKVER